MIFSNCADPDEIAREIASRSLHSLPGLTQILGVSNFAFKNTWTTTLNHKICINTSEHGFKKTLFAISAIKTAMIANRVFSKTYPEVFIQVL